MSYMNNNNINICVLYVNNIYKNIYVSINIKVYIEYII